MAKKDPFQALMANIDWTRWFQVIIPVMQPIVIFGSWLAFAKFDKRADAVSKLIALAEPIPAIDLNVPKPVVLASLFHSTDEALQILGDVIEFLQDIEIPSAEEIIDDIKDQVKEVIPGAELDLSQKQQLLSDHNACRKYADLFPIGGSLAYAGCMLRKGWSSDAWGEL
jgi:hypothetical protein